MNWSRLHFVNSITTTIHEERLLLGRARSCSPVMSETRSQVWRLACHGVPEERIGHHGEGYYLLVVPAKISNIIQTESSLLQEGQVGDVSLKVVIHCQVCRPEPLEAGVQHALGERQPAGLHLRQTIRHTANELTLPRSSSFVMMVPARPPLSAEILLIVSEMVWVE